MIVYAVYETKCDGTTIAGCFVSLDKAKRAISTRKQEDVSYFTIVRMPEGFFNSTIVEAEWWFRWDKFDKCFIECAKPPV